MLSLGRPSTLTDTHVGEFAPADQTERAKKKAAF
jgi:hypothetical protein